jgi:hypothetical protein
MVLDHWNRAKQRGARRIKVAEALEQPDLVRPGQIFVMDGGSREGVGVFERAGRTIGSINKEFLDYSEA